MPEQDSDSSIGELRFILLQMSREIIPGSFWEESNINHQYYDPLQYYRNFGRDTNLESLERIYEIVKDWLGDITYWQNESADRGGENSLLIGQNHLTLDINNLGESITKKIAGQNNEFIDNQIILASGDTQINSNDNNVSVASASQSVNTDNNIRTINGTLSADTFTFESGFSTTVIFGNGNVDFGQGSRDVIDLSHISSTTVSFSYANTPGGGVIYDAGGGNSLYDVITLDDGSKIYFQGVDAIQFADTTIELSVVPNDPLFGEQWNLHMMGVHNAWRFTTGSEQVIIGVEDTGLAVDANGNSHPDLQNSIVDTNNYVAEPSHVSHGTSVQSISSAQTNNELGISGINWVSPNYQVDVVGGDEGDFSLADATQLLIDQAQGKPLIINLSLTGGDSIEELVQNNPDNVLFVIAAGNDNQDSLASPANLARKYDNVIAVGAVWGDRDWFGNPQTPGQRTSYDDGWGSNYGDGLTGVAGAEVPAADASTNESGSADFDYGYYSDEPDTDPFFGTSAAASQTSGIASLVWSANPDLTAGQVKDILSSTAYDLGEPGYDTEYGHGLFNADAAVRAAIATSGS
ncbi:MAG: S8 family serine peptidase [Calothrix sp. MO_167.B42]|nr:S8 family serine peptidase [Calothrix sp. MO_167.B42]